MSFESFPTIQNPENEKPKNSVFLEQIENDKKVVTDLIESYKKSNRDPAIGQELKVAWEKLSEDNAKIANNNIEDLDIAA